MDREINVARIPEEKRVVVPVQLWYDHRGEAVAERRISEIVGQKNDVVSFDGKRCDISINSLQNWLVTQDMHIWYLPGPPNRYSRFKHLDGLGAVR